MKKQQALQNYWLNHFQKERTGWIFRLQRRPYSSFSVNQLLGGFVEKQVGQKLKVFEMLIFTLSLIHLLRSRNENGLRRSCLGLYHWLLYNRWVNSLHSLRLLPSLLELLHQHFNILFAFFRFSLVSLRFKIVLFRFSIMLHRFSLVNFRLIRVFLSFPFFLFCLSPHLSSFLGLTFGPVGLEAAFKVQLLYLRSLVGLNS